MSWSKRRGCIRLVRSRSSDLTTQTRRPRLWDMLLFEEEPMSKQAPDLITALEHDFLATRPSEMAVNELRRWIRIRDRVANSLMMFVPGFDWSAFAEATEADPR